MNNFPDYLVVGKWIQRFVKDAGFDELSFEMEQTMVDEVMNAALGNAELYRAVPFEQLLGVEQVWPEDNDDE